MTLQDLPDTVFVLKIGGTYYSDFGTVRVFISAREAALYKSDIEPFQDSSLAVIEVTMAAVYFDVKETLSHLYLVACTWGDDGEGDPVTLYDPAATIN